MTKNLTILALTFLLLQISGCQIASSGDKTLAQQQEKTRSANLTTPFELATNYTAGVEVTLKSWREDFTDGSGYYLLHTKLFIKNEDETGICVPRYVFGGGADSSGAFVQGFNSTRGFFDFAPSKYARDILLTPPTTFYPIDGEVFIQISYRSNFDAERVKAQIPFFFCDVPNDYDGNSADWLYIETPWSDVK